MNKKNKICFIVFLSIFIAIWLASLVFLGITSFSDTTTKSIETWYATKYEEKTLNLAKVSLYGTLLSTCAIVVTLLFKEIKKTYR